MLKPRIPFLYEIKKLIGIRFIWIVLAVFLGANMFICYSSVENKGNEKNRQYKEFFDVYKDNTHEIEEYMPEYVKKVEEIKKLEREAFMTGNEDFVAPELPSKYAPEGMSDYTLYRAVQNQKSIKQNYTDNISSILEKSIQQLQVYDAKGVDKNSFIYIYQIAIIDKYAKLLKTDFVFEYPQGYSEFFEYDWVNPFIFATVLFVCIFVFVREQRDRTAPIIRSAKNGRVKTATAKLLAVNAVSFIIVILFTITTLLAIYLKIGLSSPYQAIQMFYELCPFGITVWQGILLFILFKTVVICTFATAVTCISIFFKNYIPVLASGVIIYGISYAVSLLSEFDIDSRILALNMLYAAEPSVLFERLRMFDFLGSAITQSSMLLCIYIPLILLFAIIGIIGYCKNKVITFSFIKKLNKPNFSDKKLIIKPVHFYSIFSYEFRKLVNWKSIAIFVIAIYMVVSNTTNRFRPTTNITDRLYKSYMETLQGEWTQEKSDYIREENTRIIKITASYDKMLQQYKSKQISSNEFNKYLKEYYAAPAYSSALEKVAKQENYIKENDYEPYFIYDTGWQIFLLTDYNIYITVLIILISAISFGNEHTSGFVSILRSTKKGRQTTFINKYAIVLICSFILSLFIIILQLSIALKNVSLPLWSAPVISIKPFILLNSEISLLSFVIIRSVTIVASNMLMAVMVTSISQLLKSATFTAILSGAVFILPRYLLFAGHAYVNMLDGTRIYIESAENNLLGSRYGYLIIYISIVILLTAILLYSSKTKYCTTNLA